MARYLLLDGNSLIFRAFFAIPTDMATSSGQVTNALYGFTSMLANLVRDHRPDGIAVAFDRAEPTFRHEMVEDYKGGREETPDLLLPQLELVRDLLNALDVVTLDVAGYEADDILATLATQCRDRGDDAIVVSGDRDVYQLVEDPHVRVLYNRRGVSDYALYDEAGIRERTGVAPSSYVEYAAMRGDPSDNLPGIPGIGEKTAAKLINAYGSLDEVLAHADEQTPKLRSNLEQFGDVARTNAKAMPLVRDVPLGEVRLALGPLDSERASVVFDALEFRGLWSRIREAWASLGLGDGEESHEGVESREVVDHERDAAVVVLDDATLKSWNDATATSVPFVLIPVWEGDAARSTMSAIGVGCDDNVGVVEYPTNVQLKTLVCADRGYIAHGAKELIRACLRRDMSACDPALDLEVAAYLVNPASGSFSRDEVLGTYAGLRDDAVASSGQTALFFDGEETAHAGLGRVLRSARIAGEALRVRLESAGMWRLWNDIERPLIGVLGRMEDAGIAVDRPYLQGLADRLRDRAAELEAHVHELAGETFNVNSTPQLRHILFEKLSLTPQKKTKTGYSTDAATLERLRGEHPIVEALLSYREIEKLRSTYGEVLLAEIDHDGRIHASFRQTVARTGRLSSDKPNLHNIPVRSDEGKEFRRAFVAEPGSVLVVADYNQIELRVIAHLAQDPGLLDAFRSGQDIHTATAARVFGVSPDSVTRDMRAKSKMVSYGLAYGMEAYGLSQRLNIAVNEAQGILDAYFVAFPNVHAYMESTVELARRLGYTETLFGRRRPIPELASPNYRLRQAGERQAMNAGIQGLAADIFKIALVRLDAALATEALGARIVLQVHDEIIVECPESVADNISVITRDVMEHAATLDVPLAVNLSIAHTWADAK